MAVEKGPRSVEAIVTASSLLAVAYYSGGTTVRMWDWREPPPGWRRKTLEEHLRSLKSFFLTLEHGSRFDLLEGAGRIDKVGEIVRRSGR